MAGMTVSSCAMLRKPRSAVMCRAMVNWVEFSFVVRCCILVVLCCVMYVVMLFCMLLFIVILFLLQYICVIILLVRYKT